MLLLAFVHTISLPFCVSGVMYVDMVKGYGHNFNEFDKGWYFPILSAETDMGQAIADYIYKRGDVREWLERLREKGKRIFLVCIWVFVWFTLCSFLRDCLHTLGLKPLVRICVYLRCLTTRRSWNFS